ncbi:MAG: hypothetical protein GY865_06855 [candidate division Zixibacteria bacterium]|nr:hypothetical protein [candidate division Zixibacteria bacterium]
MSNYTERQVIGSISPDNNIGWVDVKILNQDLKDGIVINSTNFRYRLNPDSDMSEQPEEVKVFCKAYWTDELKGKWGDNAEESEKLKGVK